LRTSGHYYSGSDDHYSGSDDHYSGSDDHYSGYDDHYSGYNNCCTDNPRTYAGDDYSYAYSANLPYGIRI
jgi:hypothetical protein